MKCKQGPPPLAPAKAPPSQADPSPLSPTQRSSAFTTKSNNPMSPKGAQDPGALRPDPLSQPGSSEQQPALLRQAASSAQSRAPGMNRFWSQDILTAVDMRCCLAGSCHPHTLQTTLTIIAPRTLQTTLTTLAPRTLQTTLTTIAPCTLQTTLTAIAVWLFLQTALCA